MNTHITIYMQTPIVPQDHGGPAIGDPARWKLSVSVHIVKPSDDDDDKSRNLAVAVGGSFSEADGAHVNAAWKDIVAKARTIYGFVPNTNRGSRESFTIHSSNDGVISAYLSVLLTPLFCSEVSTLKPIISLKNDRYDSRPVLMNFLQSCL